MLEHQTGKVTVQTLRRKKLPSNIDDFAASKHQMRTATRVKISETRLPSKK